MLLEVEKLEREIYEKKKQLAELRQSVPEQRIDNYDFVASNGKKVTLLDLFENNNELIVIHNMGESCSYCTMWADGFNGIYHQLIGKASFVVSSPDAPEVQENFAAERKWQFPMVSVKESTFAIDLGFQKESFYHPGVSTFRKDEQGQIYLHAQAPLGPGDEYCVTWSLLDLLPSGSNDFKVQKKINARSEFQLTNNIAIGVTDYENAIQFYQTILGMKLEQTLENETKLSISGTNLFIENSVNNTVFFEFAVENVETTKKNLLENGCMVTKEYSENSVMFKDPYGMQFHIFES